MPQAPEAPHVLPWQHRLWARVRSGVANDRLGHALLLAGPANIGKRHFARVLARTLLCAARTENSCGECSSCRQFDAGTHPDYVEMAPEGAGQAISIDSVRELSRQLHLTSQYRRGRIGLLLQAERMTSAAANSLLKTLEEPPADSRLILVTRRAMGLPATIRSRCQIIRFPSPDAEAAAQWLTAQGLAKELAAHFSPAPLAALEQAGDDVVARRGAWSRDIVALTCGQTDPVTVTESWIEAPLAEVLDWLYGWTLDLVRARAGLPPAELTNRVNAEKLLELAFATEDASLARFADEVVRARALAGTQVNAQLLLESLLAQWSALYEGYNEATRS